LADRTKNRLAAIGHPWLIARTNGRIRVVSLDTRRCDGTGNEVRRRRILFDQCFLKGTQI
jgi:hypothetical protein